jgi:NDP-sugar pyrophosphorylase family protein
MKEYRLISREEIIRLKEQRCHSENWDKIWVDPDFRPERVWDTAFSGDIRLGVFETKKELLSGIKIQSGICNAKLHNVSVGDNTCIENIHSYIANYNIGSGCIIENIDKIYTEGISSFGNGVEVSVLNEMGGREVPINNKLTAHFAYILALYRHKTELVKRMRELVRVYAAKIASDRGTIGDHVIISHSGTLKNVAIGDCTTIEGTSSLVNGSINGNAYDPVYIGYGVNCEDFIISSGAKVESGVNIRNCFVGQGTILGKAYSANDSLFFSNCFGENGEACSVFAGPYTVSHHKSTLLIAGMFSFMNAGSGSNQSNHMYKLGPIHQGIMERGSKTTSDSYILWPSRIGAFSLVMGRHVNNTDTSSLPFSYLIEQDNTTYLIPGVNLKSVGTIRDVQKWPKRDLRKDPVKLDQINYNLLSPYTIQKMLNGRAILQELMRVSGETTDVFSYKSTKINNTSLVNGIRYYEIAIKKFLGNSIIKRLENKQFGSIEEIRDRLRPDTAIGLGEWLDISGLIAPRSEIDKLIHGIETREISKITDINKFVEELHRNYYYYEWTWAYSKIKEFYGIDPEDITINQIREIVKEWEDAVVGLDRMLYEDARKEFSLSSMTGFGADGNMDECRLDFEQVRGAFENNPFVAAVLKHIEDKTALGQELIIRLSALHSSSRFCSK